MAGSWNHTVEHAEDGKAVTAGKLLPPVDLCGMLETRSGDVYEYAEEAYGMVWWLASELAKERADRSGMGLSPAEYIERAQQNYKLGLELSPGIAEEGMLEDAEED